MSVYVSHAAIPGICASVSTVSPERWCVDGPLLLGGSAPTQPQWALDGSGGISPFLPSCVAPCSPQSGAV